MVATPGDVTRLQDNQRVVEQTVRAFGQLDIFVGNAGIFARYLSLADLPEEKLGDVFDEQFGMNVKGCLLGAKEALPGLLKTKGCLIFTASVVWAALDQSEQSHWAAPDIDWEERLRAGAPRIGSAPVRKAAAG